MADDDGPVAGEIEEVDRVRDHSADGEKERLAPSMHASVPIELGDRERDEVDIVGPVELAQRQVALCRGLPERFDRVDVLAVAECCVEADDPADEGVVGRL